MNLTILITAMQFFIFNLFGTAESSGPKDFAVVKPFSISRYAGQWYEIARMDFRFEKNLSNVTADYTLNTNGTIKVVNRGFDYTKKVWKEAVGKAKFSGNPYEARLKVSFFGPFYAAYNVIALDSDYRYALVAGKNTGYLWILSREITIPDEIKNSYLKIASDLGFDTSVLTWTAQKKE